MLKISDNVHEVGASHPELCYFDRLMPTEYGTTYNSYLIQGEKTVLIDPVELEKKEVLLKNLKDLGITKLDYLICLHTEQDHAGSTPDILAAYPGVQLVSNAKVAEFMENHIHIPRTEFRIMADGDTLDLGGLSLSFKSIPFSHWPDNTMVYLEEEKMLFSSDLFGSHYAALDPAQPDFKLQIKEAQAYYAEIMMPTRQQTGKHAEWVRELNPDMILPSHGPVWHDPEVILSLYARWTSDAVAPAVVIPYVTMHESTGVMAKYLAEKIAEKGIKADLCDLGLSDKDLRQTAGEALYLSVDAAAVVLAAPTVLTGPHPSMMFFAALMNGMRVKARFLGLIGSFGWGTQIEKSLKSLTERLKGEHLPPVLCKGLPREEDFAALDNYAEEIVKKIKALPPEDVLD